VMKTKSLRQGSVAASLSSFRGIGLCLTAATTDNSAEEALFVATTIGVEDR
jgi:hypothetical protein